MRDLPSPEELGAWPDPLQVIPPVVKADELGWFQRQWHRLRNLGKPLLVGLAVISSSFGLLAYVLATWAWRLTVRVAWRRRVRDRQRRKLMSPPHRDSPPPTDGARDRHP